MIGPCNTKKPGLFDIVGQAKWNAWNQLGDLSQVIIICDLILENRPSCHI